MPLTMLDIINDPGVKLGQDTFTAGRTGDDRAGFDESAETAWVVDGATDVGDIRVFDSAESDAAWFAEALSRRLTNPPALDEDGAVYWRAVLSDVRAETAAAARMSLDAIPGGSRPCASGVWLRRRPEAQRAELAWLGDCVAIISGEGAPARAYGDLMNIKDEIGTAQTYHSLDADGRRRMLQDARARATASGLSGVFSLHPDAADHMRTDEVAMPTGATALLMSDGFFRLVTPFARYDADSLLTAAQRRGLGALISELRDLESAPEQVGDVARFKKADDACAVLLRAE